MTIHTSRARRVAAALIAVALPATAVLTVGSAASAANSPRVPLGTSAQYSVLGAETVTNTGNSVLAASLGLSPGTDITGFPPGQVLPPGTTNATNTAAAKAQQDLTTAYLNAKGRSIDGTTPADLADLELQAGVYAGPSHGALTLNGPLVLDGAGDPTSVFIFQTDSSLITGAGSTVSLINGAQECNVFWQVGSSATLGTASVFTGNILALTSIWFTDSVTVHGRALATTGEVTLINDTFTKPTCDMRTPVGGGGGGSGGGSTTTTPGGGTPTTVGSPTGATPGGPAGPGTPGLTPSGPGVPPVIGPPRTGGARLPTGGTQWLGVMAGTLLAAAGTAGIALRKRL
ncbi:MAG: hypothetical protein QOI95_3329 [Acidimicrobiaceae bacterium]|jgi:hypothetical protein